MKSIPDSFFDDAPSVESDIGGTFERVWRELGARDEQQEDSDVDRDSVWLECTGDLVDLWSVQIVGVRRSALGVRMVEFVCPRCNQGHESIQFR